jgi:hypothetical protein
MNQVNKYLIILSVILNAGLLMALTGIIPFLLYTSLLLNLGLIWLVKKVIIRSRDILDDMDNITKFTYDLQLHLQSIYELETFYGDETLRDLIQHMLETNENIEKVQERYSLEEDDELLSSLEETRAKTEETQFDSPKKKED